MVGQRTLTPLMLVRPQLEDPLPLGVVGSAAHSECEGAWFETRRGIQVSPSLQMGRSSTPLSKVLPGTQWLGAMLVQGWRHASGAQHGQLAQLVVATVS